MNAIILAAGLGSRFQAVTKNNHKALLPIGGIPNIERTIQYLQEAGIKEICIVTGHMSEMFEYLQDRYGCRLVYNEKYAEYNNRYSMKLALPYLQDSFVVDADVVLFRNIFEIEPKGSFYFTIQRAEQEAKEWCPIVNEQGIVTEMRVTNDAIPSLLGISYWTKEAAEQIKQAFPLYTGEEQLLEHRYYWDDIPVALLETLQAGVKQVAYEDADEMDTVENYRDICKRYTAHCLHHSNMDE